MIYDVYWYQPPGRVSVSVLWRSYYPSYDLSIIFNLQHVNYFKHMIYIWISHIKQWPLSQIFPEIGLLMLPVSAIFSALTSSSMSPSRAFNSPSRLSLASSRDSNSDGGKLIVNPFFSRLLVPPLWQMFLPHSLIELHGNYVHLPLISTCSFAVRALCASASALVALSLASSSAHYAESENQDWSLKLRFCRLLIPQWAALCKFSVRWMQFTHPARHFGVPARLCPSPPIYSPVLPVWYSVLYIIM